MKKHLLLAVAIIILAGCITPQAEKAEEQAEILEVKPVVDYYALGGFTGGAGESFFVVAGNLDEAMEKTRALITGEAKQEGEFETGEPLNLVVFRGVFSTGGYGLEIERVEKVGDRFVVHATYTDPGKGMIVTQAFTQPTAVIPIGKLSKGSHEARLKVTRILRSEEGDEILEEENERESIVFKVG